MHTFAASIVNELRVGYTQNNLGITTPIPGVPSIYFDDGTAGFGSYSGYPQFFKEHDYSYGDMVSISHGKHSIKVGVDIKRNLENSEFNVARPSYEMFDPIYFAADAPAGEAAGVDPGFVNNSPAQLATNIRHWRNLKYGGYFQDDWKVSKRRDLESWVFVMTSSLVITKKTIWPRRSSSVREQHRPADCERQVRLAATLPDGSTCNPGNPNRNHGGSCGRRICRRRKPSGKGDHNDFGPRVGFAWDVFGDGKTSLRGGFGVSYESTLYNPLSNSRWDPPYYSFNSAQDALEWRRRHSDLRPFNMQLTSVVHPPGVTPTFTGPGTNPGNGRRGTSHGQHRGMGSRSILTWLSDRNRAAAGNS